MGSPTAHATTPAASTWNPLASANTSLASASASAPAPASAPRLALERAQSFAAAPRRPRRYSGRIPAVQGPSSARPGAMYPRSHRPPPGRSEITPAATGEEVARRDRLPGAGGTGGGHCTTAASPAGTATRTTSWQRVQSETFMARISCGRSTPPPDTPRSPSTTPPVAALLAFRAPDGCNRPAIKSKPSGTGAGPSIKESSPKQAPGPGAPQQPHSSRGEKTK